MAKNWKQTTENSPNLSTPAAPQGPERRHKSASGAPPAEPRTSPTHRAPGVALGNTCNAPPAEVERKGSDRQYKRPLGRRSAACLKTPRT